MHFYKNGNYVVCMMDDGTKIRKTDDDSFIPSFAENVDVCITRKCKIGCGFCSESCSLFGKHGNILKYKFLDTLHPYTEMAINGNDMDHPQLLSFLCKLKDKHVYANITVHQKQFMENRNLIKDLIKNKLIYGLGVSYSYYSDEWIDEIKQIPNAVIHTINGIITLDDLNKLKYNNLKILILGYKEIRKGAYYLESHVDTIKNNQSELSENLERIINERWFKVVSFDNLAIKQLGVKDIVPHEKWNEFYMGDDGKYTFYIDAVEGKFAKNSCTIGTRYDIGDKSIDEMFNIIKNNN